MNLAHRRWLEVVVPLLIIAVPPPALASEFSGRFYELGSGRSKLLFTNKGTETVTGARRVQSVVFKGLDGADLVLEQTVWEGGAVTRFEFDQRQIHEQGSVDVGPDTVTFRYTSEGKTKTATEKRTANFIVPGTLDEYVGAHWSEIQRGDSVAVRFAVLDRLETIGFKFFKDKDLTLDGKKYVVVSMVPSDFFIRLLVKKVSIVFEERGDGILEIIGRTSPKLREGKSWVDCDAEGVFTTP